MSLNFHCLLPGHGHQGLHVDYPFGVPAGARMVACPHCQAVNNVASVTQSM